MSTEHITNLLEARSLNGLTAGDRRAIEHHIKDCTACLKAYRAAVITAELLQARAGDAVAPSPFFKTRVMAALRQQKAEPQFSLTTLWQTARALVASMAMVLVILVGVNFYIGSFGAPTEFEDSDNIYSTEWVLLENGDAANSVTDNEALTTLYEAPNDDEQDN